ncbi:MAG TPA: flagellar hook-length control protein FliK [Candidatus Sulfotelmatobacter sp.]|nr:flagellar hook-length control protein FliK [Candidatus Sulfotelmatobacter sp.]
MPVIATLIAVAAAEATSGTSTTGTKPATAAPQPTGPSVPTPDPTSALGAPAQTGNTAAASGSAPAAGGGGTTPATPSEAETLAADFAAFAAAGTAASAANAGATANAASAATTNSATAGTGKTAAQVLAQLNSANVEVQIAAADDPGQSGFGNLANGSGTPGGAPATTTPAATTGTAGALSGDTLLLSQLGEAAHQTDAAAASAGTEASGLLPGDANAVAVGGTTTPQSTTPSAAASAPPPARPTAPLLPLLDQILPNLSQAANGDGSGRFTIQLRPPELGKVQVDLKIDDTGHVTATITADHQDTLSLLQRNSHQLEQALNDAGLSTNNGDLQFSLSGDSHGTTFDEPNSNSFTNAGAAAAAAAPVDDPTTPAMTRQIAGLSLVDVHV